MAEMADETTYCSQISTSRSAELRLYAHASNSPFITIVDRQGMVCVDGDGHPPCVISREAGLLFPRHSMRVRSDVVWRLSTVSALRNRHVLEVSGARWKLTTPFFSLSITGEEAGGRKLCGRVGRRKSEWHFSVATERATPELLSGLAFVHWRWYFAS